jgi:hypothetical protein
MDRCIHPDVHNDPLSSPAPETPLDNSKKRERKRAARIRQAGHTAAPFTRTRLPAPRAKYLDIEIL